jgi:hypothetical protein
MDRVRLQIRLQRLVWRLLAKRKAFILLIVFDNKQLMTPYIVLRQACWALLFLPLLWAQPLAAQSLGEVLGGSDEEESAEQSDSIKVVINGEEHRIGKQLKIDPGTVYDVEITRLAPNSEVTIEMRKAGAKVGERSFDANSRGEFMFQYRTPQKRIKGTALLHYTTSSGREVHRKTKVIMR